MKRISLNKLPGVIVRCPRMSFLLIVFLAIAASGCGRKDAPRAPESYAPGPVQFLSARGEVDAIVLSWSAPENSSGDEDTVAVVGYEVRRRPYQKDKPAAFAEIAEIEISAEDSEEGTQAAKEGEVLTYSDKDIKPGQQFEYIVLAVGDGGVIGVPTVILRVTFIGESSVVDIRPFSRAAR